ncbi:hypothetical protein ACH492_38410 [Streptomyces sp. NPDC019443]|uniref:hypothetical protein n=1 Tax=Streptomyces sp. NPDC019443 TaxID=3365061 RepID=UPI0037A4B2E6
MCGRLTILGLAGDLRTPANGQWEIISPPGAEIPVLVVPTGEAQQVARETRDAGPPARPLRGAACILLPQP